jgi:RimJ/RimL family protein N-acetyltransferase
MNDAIHIRQLDHDDWELFRTIRLRALADTPQFFGASYAQEIQFSEQQWQERVHQHNRIAHFGLFADKHIIGLTGIVLDRDDPSDRTALLIASYILPTYRRRGLSDLLYQARINWAKRHPTVEKIVVSHRFDNEASRRANQRHGFVYTHSITRGWHDGKTADEIFHQHTMTKARHETV